MTDRPKVNYLKTLLWRSSCCRLLVLLRSRCWCPSLGLDLRLIHRLRSLARECGALRHDVEINLGRAFVPVRVCIRGASIACLASPLDRYAFEFTARSAESVGFFSSGAC